VNLDLDLISLWLDSVLISVLVLLSITMKMINNQSNQRVGSPYVMLKQFVIYLILGFLLLIAGLIVVEDISGYPISLIILISVIYYSYRLNTIYSVKIKSRVIYYHNLFIGVNYHWKTLNLSKYLKSFHFQLKFK
jgi:hypothetical protein